jgi:hypothetical protein
VPEPLLGNALLALLSGSAPDRWSRLVAFYRSWFDLLPEVRPARGPDRDGRPAAVVEWHALWQDIEVLQRSAVAEHPCMWHPLEAGVHVFQAENQYVVSWGIRDQDLHLDDPPVVMSWDDETFEPVAPSVSTFALQLVLLLTGLAGWEGVQAWTQAFTPSQIRRVTDRLQPLPFESWSWPEAPTRLWTGEGVLVVDAGGELHLQVRDDAALAEVCQRLELDPEDFEIRSS